MGERNYTAPANQREALLGILSDNTYGTEEDSTLGGYGLPMYMPNWAADGSAALVITTREKETEPVGLSIMLGEDNLSDEEEQAVGDIAKYIGKRGIDLTKA